MADSPDAALRALMAGLGQEFKTHKGSGASSTKDVSQAFIDSLRALARKDVTVGIPAENADRQDGDELNNAARLYIHEFGAPEANIPARATVMPGIEAARDRINAFMGAAARAATAGDMEKADQAMHSAGIVAADSIKEMINSNTPPPLAERTIADRIERGLTRTNTLVDEAEMRNAVTYIVRDKGTE